MKKETCSRYKYKDRAASDYPCRNCAVISTNNFVPDDSKENKPAKDNCDNCKHRNVGPGLYPCIDCFYGSIQGTKDRSEPVDPKKPEYKLPEGCRLYPVSSPDWAARRYITMAKRETFIPEIEGCSQFRGYLLVDPRNPANYRISNNVLCWTDGKKDFYAKLYPDCYPAELKGVVWEEHRNY